MGGDSASGEVPRALRVGVFAVRVGVFAVRVGDSRWQSVAVVTVGVRSHFIALIGW